MPVLDRDALQASPLADLHTIASELSLDGYRRLRKAELIDRILDRQGGTEAQQTEPQDGEEPTEAPKESANGARRRRGRRGGRARSEDGGESTTETETEPEPTPRRTRERAPKADRPARGGRAEETPEAEEQVVEGIVELLPGGSGFVRVSPPGPSDDDIYISAAQVKRCELVSGDTVSGPRRAPRRSERFASLVRVDTINGTPAGEVSGGTRFDDLPAEFPAESISLESEDPTVKAIESQTPFGRGSRVTITGPARAGKTEALRRLATALAGQEGLQVSLVLAGVRPEEISEWRAAEPAPAQAVSFAASAEAQDQAVEQVVDQARRIAGRGAHAVVLIDTLDGLHPQAARKALAAARNLVDGGSLTVIATASQPIGGETTVIALDAALAAAGRFPAIDLTRSGTLRPERLVGEAGAQAIAQARAESLGA
jgi:transcription termination factor Rho